jgi:phosphoglycolate phosphatase
MNKTAVVFDFDGTLADVEEILKDIYGDFAERQGWPKLDKNTYQQLKVGGARMAIKLLGLRLWQLPKLIKLGIVEYKKRTTEIKLFDDVDIIINNLAKNHNLYILSSNDQQVVREILDHNKLKTDIEILKGSPIFGKDKPLKRLLKSNNYDPSDSWMIGDEARDIEAGKKAGMNTIAVSWGLQSVKGLALANPDFIAKKPADIERIINAR